MATAVREGDVKRLCTVSGVGKKTGQQIILDLAGKLGGLEDVLPSAPEMNQVSSALCNLGFRRGKVDRALRVLRDRGEADSPFDDVLRAALALLREM